LVSETVTTVAAVLVEVTSIVALPSPLAVTEQEVDPQPSVADPLVTEYRTVSPLAAVPSEPFATTANASGTCIGI
jgi:hypothetical protein